VITDEIQKMGFWIRLVMTVNDTREKIQKMGPFAKLLKIVYTKIVYTKKIP